jgi:hypothetical protein
VHAPTFGSGRFYGEEYSGPTFPWCWSFRSRAVTKTNHVVVMNEGNNCRRKKGQGHFISEQTGYDLGVKISAVRCRRCSACSLPSSISASTSVFSV